MVAKPLFASENEQLILQALPAPGRPCGGRKAIGNADLERDAPLVFAPAIQPAAMQQFDQRHAEQDLIVIGRDLKRALHLGKRFLEAAELVEGLGAVHVIHRRNDVVAIELDRAVEALDFVLETSLIPVYDRPAKVCFRHVGPDRQGAVIARERLLAPGKPRQRIAAVEVDLGEVRVGRERAVETLDRGLVASQCSQDIAAVGVCHSEVGA